MSERIAVVGLGYVGLPLCMVLAEKFDNVIGFDIDGNRVQSLQQGNDWTSEVAESALRKTAATFTCDPVKLSDRTFIIVTVPTPVDISKRPDLTPILGACKLIGNALRDCEVNAQQVPLIVFESTVYPGLTERECAQELAESSGRVVGSGFHLGYSPERINPGDKSHQLTTITKVISAADSNSLARMEAVYGKIITAGLHKAPSIAIAEAGKVIENIQRDINIALMNEIAVICDHLGIRTRDVLDAAGTKWNFLPFTPGLVGGHCIGVDPYYLTHRAQEVGHHPDVILAGRRTNDMMPKFIARKVLCLLATTKHKSPPRIGIIGLTFKEDIRDIRNSRVPEIAHELNNFGASVVVHDPHALKEHALISYGIELADFTELADLDVLILAVPHKIFTDNQQSLWSCLNDGGIFIDIKSAIPPQNVPANLAYWSL